VLLDFRPPLKDVSLLVYDSANDFSVKRTSAGTWFG
jgi:hypothetical protein